MRVQRRKSYCVNKMTVRLIGTLVVLSMLLVFLPQPASAYTDPGSGAMVYQVAYAAFLAGSFYIRRLLERVFRRK
jgi:hypothetical protein